MTGEVTHNNKRMVCILHSLIEIIQSSIVVFGWWEVDTHTCLAAIS